MHNSLPRNGLPVLGFADDAAADQKVTERLVASLVDGGNQVTVGELDDLGDAAAPQHQAPGRADLVEIEQHRGQRAHREVARTQSSFSDRQR